MEIKKVAGKALKWGTITTIGLYAAAYIGLTAHAIYDSKQLHMHKSEEEQFSLLKIKRFKVRVDGKEKHFTLVGEPHSYNKSEYEIMKRLVYEHSQFAYEGGKRGRQSSVNYTYQEIFDKLSKINSFYFKLGTNRFYGNMFVIAKKEGKHVHSLENPYNVFDGIPFDEKLALLSDIAYSALTAPLTYYNAELLEFALMILSEDRAGDIGLIGIRSQKYLVEDRDKKMSKSLVDILKQEEIDKLLAGVGRGHLQGIIINLAQQIELEEIKPQNK